MPSAVTRISSFSRALEDVNKAAQDDTHGTGRAHYSLLESIQRLTLAAEKLSETLMRFRFEVRHFELVSSLNTLRVLLAKKYMLMQIISLSRCRMLR